MKLTTWHERRGWTISERLKYARNYKNHVNLLVCIRFDVSSMWSAPHRRRLTVDQHNVSILINHMHPSVVQSALALYNPLLLLCLFTRCFICHNFHFFSRHFFRKISQHFECANFLINFLVSFVWSISLRNTTMKTESSRWFVESVGGLSRHMSRICKMCNKTMKSLDTRITWKRILHFT